MQHLNPADLPLDVGHDDAQEIIDLAGHAPADFAAQAELAWGHVVRAVHAAGMGMQHVVKTTTYLVDRADIAPMRPIRLRHLGESRPASTLVLVQGLLDPAWRIEVEAVAFRPHPGT